MTNDYIHIITFIRRAKQFANAHLSTSLMKVDKDNNSEDLDWGNLCISPGGLIAGIDNDLSEMADVLIKYYTETNNKKALNRLQKALNNK
jgi:hypothetical protein